jgi:DNA-directed RNA polymerase subunit RPC12/RpoP
MDQYKEALRETTSDLTTDSRQRRFLVEHSSCAMCDTKLEIRHEINKNDLKIKEEAHCPSCGIRVRVAHHMMH